MEIEEVIKFVALALTIDDLSKRTPSENPLDEEDNKTFFALKQYAKNLENANAQIDVFKRVQNGEL